MQKKGNNIENQINTKKKHVKDEVDDFLDADRRVKRSKKSKKKKYKSRSPRRRKSP